MPPTLDKPVLDARTHATSSQISGTVVGTYHVTNADTGADAPSRTRVLTQTVPHTQICARPLCTRHGYIGTGRTWDSEERGSCIPARLGIAPTPRAAARAVATGPASTPLPPAPPPPAPPAVADGRFRDGGYPETPPRSPAFACSDALPWEAAAMWVYVTLAWRFWCAGPVGAAGCWCW